MHIYEDFVLEERVYQGTRSFCLIGNGFENNDLEVENTVNAEVLINSINELREERDALKRGLK